MWSNHLSDKNVCKYFGRIMLPILLRKDFFFLKYLVVKNTCWHLLLFNSPQKSTFKWVQNKLLTWLVIDLIKINSIDSIFFLMYWLKFSYHNWPVLYFCFQILRQSWCSNFAKQIQYLDYFVMYWLKFKWWCCLKYSIE